MKTGTSLLMAAVGLFLCSYCPGTTRTVTPPGGGGDYTTIQAAVNGSVHGDEIVVAPGTYMEAVDMNGKRVRLYSSGGPEVTIINGTGKLHVLRCDSSETSATIIEGFTITGGYANRADFDPRRGAGIFNVSSSPTIIDCIFSNNVHFHR